MLRIPHVLDNRLTDGGKIVSLTHRPLFTPQKHTIIYNNNNNNNNNNSVALARERTIPIVRPQLVGEVSANFCEERGIAWSVWRVPYGRILGFLGSI
jgi:hypothetical protein